MPEPCSVAKQVRHRKWDETAQAILIRPSLLLQCHLPWVRAQILKQTRYAWRNKRGR
jgi:hypothetical protein